MSGRLSIDDFLQRLRGVSRCGFGYVAHCPAHLDLQPSLSVNEGRDGRILVRCHAGCQFDAICASVGIEQFQLFPEPSARRWHQCVIGGSGRTQNGQFSLPTPNAAFGEWAMSIASSTPAEKLNALATQLGVSVSALQSLCVGWSPLHLAWTIPERHPDGWIIGIGLRMPDGDLRMVYGSHHGLILPNGWWNYCGDVFLPEGMSDVATLLTHGLQPIGRPSAFGGIDLLVDLFSNRPLLRPIIVGENDMKPDGKWPGRAGAEKCAAALAERLQREVRIWFPPEPFKDIREFSQGLEHGWR